MPFLNKDEKPPLLDERQSIQNAKAAWVGVGGLGGSVALIAAIPAGLVVAPIALATILVVVLQRQENGVNRLLDDPPRLDFTTPTKARSRRYVAGQLGESDLAIATDQAALATLRVNAYAEALVRADERAQGARNAGDEQSAGEREREAFQFLERMRAASLDQAEILDELALIWAGIGAKLTDLEDAAADLDVGPSSSVEAGLRRTRLVVSDLPAALRSPRPVEAGAATDPLSAVARASSETRNLARSGVAFFDDARTQLAAELVPGTDSHRKRPEELLKGLDALSLENPERAEPLLLEAANQGSPDAMFELGALALQRADREQAGLWFQRASQNVDLIRRSWISELRDPEASELSDPESRREIESGKEEN